MVGSRTRAKIVKNKVAAPFREAEFDIIYGEGVSREGDLLDLGVSNGLLEKSGTWISYKNERLGQGRSSQHVVQLASAFGLSNVCRNGNKFDRFVKM